MQDLLVISRVCQYTIKHQYIKLLNTWEFAVVRMAVEALVVNICSVFNAIYPFSWVKYSIQSFHTCTLQNKYTVYFLYFVVKTF